MAAMGQREMRGAVGNREGGGGDEIHRIGDRHDRGGVKHDFLGIAAAVAQDGEHPLPGLKAVDRAAGLDDLAGGFEPWGEGERRFHLIGAAHHQAVGEVQASSRTRTRTWCGSRLGLSASSSRSTSGAPHSRQRIALISRSSPCIDRPGRR